MHDTECLPDFIQIGPLTRVPRKAVKLITFRAQEKERVKRHLERQAAHVKVDRTGEPVIDPKTKKPILTEDAAYAADALELSNWDEAPGVCVLDDGQVFLCYYGRPEIDAQLAVLDVAKAARERILASSGA